MTLRGPSSEQLDSRPERRVRSSMYAAFLALAALALFQAGYANRLEKVRAADTEIVGIAGMQRTFTQQMGRMAALAGGDTLGDKVHAELLTEALDRSRTEALLFEALSAEQLARGGQEAAVGDALATWQSARERLWYRAENFLSRLGEVQGEPLRQAAAALQQEVDPTLSAASVLVDRLQGAAMRRSGTQLQLLEAGVALTWLLLGLLAALVVEPMARAVRDQLRRLRQQTRELERLALVAARTDNVVIVCNAERRIDWANDAFTRLTGYSLVEAQGCDVVNLLHRDINDDDTLRRVRSALTSGEGLRVELQARSKSGRIFWVDTDLQAVVDAQGVVQGFLSVGTDVTERRQLQEQLRHAARTDALTGLPNRAVVQDRLQRAILHAQRHPGYGFAVLFMDFDRFKQINDTLGHSAGDELLRQIARRIEDTLRPGDAVARVSPRSETAARIGGDEFVVVLEGVHGPDEATVVANRLLEVLGQPYLIRGQAVQSGASIGIVTADHATGSADELLRDADTAMYEAKRAGRGRCVVFNSGMHDRVVLALEMENDLRQALRDHELFVVYQPVVALGSEQMTGVEALVRWRHPTKGLVPPVQFISVAEEVGLIDAIGQQVLQTACRQLAAWQRTLGPQAPGLLAVNLSRAQLQQPGLALWVGSVLAHNGLAPQALQLEVTESLAAQDERVQATLRELKALGVKLALDDFGTGYSSLACLHQLPVDTVKIDRSFVTQAERVEYHRVLIEATIRVAQTLGMTTVAEGIETPAQAALMQRLHCDRGQGYLYAKPLTADELAAWAVRPRPRLAPPSGAHTATLAGPAKVSPPVVDFADTDTPDTSLQHA